MRVDLLGIGDIDPGTSEYNLRILGATRLCTSDASCVLQVGLGLKSFGVATSLDLDLGGRVGEL